VQSSKKILDFLALVKNTFHWQLLVGLKNGVNGDYREDEIVNLEVAFQTGNVF
jgi:hypothetical protein